jgi:hypothetical protein
MTGNLAKDRFITPECAHNQKVTAFFTGMVQEHIAGGKIK